MSLIGRESNIWAWPRVGLPRMIGQYMNFGSTHLLKTWFEILVNENDKTAILSSFDHNHKNTRFGAKITCQTTNLSSYTELSNLSPLLSRSC